MHIYTFHKVNPYGLRNQVALSSYGFDQAVAKAFLKFFSEKANVNVGFVGGRFPYHLRQCLSGNGLPTVLDETLRNLKLLWAELYVSVANGQSRVRAIQSQSQALGLWEGKFIRQKRFSVPHDLTPQQAHFKRSVQNERTKSVRRVA